LTLSLSSLLLRVVWIHRCIRCFDRIPPYFKQERFGNCLGRVGAILFALSWFVAIPRTGVLAFFFPNPLARGCVSLLLLHHAW
jgi:hypothetical protein